ncbi:MAG TPA: aspartate aminotransferase family protein [Thermodesulfobacteriota bacterium]|nr:aspartate aminotransferase family protein [Thermodesulfobacteriota bacterium]
MNTIEKYKKYVNTSMLARVEPVVISKAKGAVVTDADGKNYIDCFAGIAVVNAGHCNEKVIEAAKAQMDKLIHCCSYVYYAQPTADLAEKLAEITPGRLQKTFFGNGGAEAIEGAMRLAKTFTGKTELIALQASFHGRSYATLSVTGNNARKRRGGPYMVGCSFLPAPYCYRCFFELEYPKCHLRCARALEDIIHFDTYDSVAAFIAEPLLGEGGIITPPDDYFQEIEKVLKKHGILLIIDEVQTGFGRTGKMFGIEHYGVEPDIMTMAKGIADGFPLSAFTAREEIADSFKPGEHLSTFGGNPVSCAAALANIASLKEEKLVEEAATKGEWLKARLEEMKKKQSRIGEVRGKGLMIGIELVNDRAARTPAIDEAKKTRQFCLDQGLLIGLGGVFNNVLRIQPPLVISQRQLEEVVKILDLALSKV